MTYAELQSIMGKEAILETLHEHLTVYVRIIDGRTAYGRQDVLVEPLSGEGSVWVSAERVRLRKGAK